MVTLARRALLGLLLALAALGATAPAAGAVVPADFYGMTTIGQLTTDNEAEEMQRLGIHTVRLNIVWRDFQQADCNNENVTGLNFSTFDARVQRAAEHNMTVLGDFYGSRLPVKCPNGADLHHFPIPGTPLENDYVFAEKEGSKGGFVWQVVQRYGQNGSFWYEHPNLTPHPIKIWEVWNEENLKGNNPPDGKSIQPQWYAKLLIDTSYTIKKAQEVLIGQNPYNIGTRVLLGGLWGDSRYSNGNTFDWPMEKYMKAIYNEATGYTAAEAHAAFDGYSYHPYALHGNETNAEQTIGGTVPVRANLGDSGKSLWITEIGWQVAFGEGLGLPSYNAEQAGNMLNAVLSWTYNNQAYLNAQYAATYVYQDPSNPCTNEVGCWDEHAGIRDANGTERPAWCAISNLANSNGSCEFASPHLGTEPASNVQEAQATLRGWVQPRGLKAHYTFQWGKTTSYTNENPVPPGGYVGWQPSAKEVTETIYFLTPGTTYHYRVVATSAAGTSYGNDRTFTTPGPPAVTTEPDSTTTTTTANLNGKINPNGLATTYQFEYGKTTAYGTNVPSTPKSAGSGTGDIAVSANIDGLAPLTTYHYRIVATNSMGTSYGADRILTTQATGGKFVPSTSWTTWSTTYSMALADVNGDGKADIIGRNISTGDVQVGISTGTKFSPSTTWIGWGSAYSMEFADVNGDGKADIVGRNSSTGDVQVGISTGVNFTPSTTWIGWGSAYSLALADVNGDGKADIVGRNSSTGDVQVGISTGVNFTPSTSWTTWSTSYTMLLADVNGDGRGDLVGRYSTGDVQAGPSSGSGFAASSSWTTWSTTYSMELADVNGDKRADIVGRNSSGDVQVGLSTN
jgi:hypothetical protein